MTTPGPGSEHRPPDGDASLLSVREDLEQALSYLQAVDDGALPIADVERSIGAALQHTYGALADLGDSSVFREQTDSATSRARDALASVMASPSEDPGAGAVAASIARALGKLVEVRWSMVKGLDLPTLQRAAPYMRASTRFPQLLRPRRTVMRAAMPLPEPSVQVTAAMPPPAEARPVSLEELLALAAQHQRELEEFEGASAEIAPGQSAPGQTEPAQAEPAEPGPPVEPLAEDAAVRERFGVALGDHELLVERAQELLEELAMFGRMRRGTELDRWAAGEETERRMLTRVDAIAACGVEAFPELVRLLDDRPVPDPELTFGNVYFFLSVGGDDTFHQALRLLEQADLDEPGMLELCTDALVFSPHPRTNHACEHWLRRPEPSWRRMAAEALRRRCALRAEHYALATVDEDPRLLASLARGLPALGAAAPTGVLGWFLQHPDEAVVREALGASLLLRNPRGIERAIELTLERGGAWADAALVVAVVGRPSEREVLERAASTSGAPSVLRALGWYGDLTFVPFLLGRFRHGSDPERAAALSAIERLTGASIIDPELVADYPKHDEPFLRERRDYQPVKLLSDDADAWEQWWRRWQPRDLGGRFRWGHRYSTLDDRHELTDGQFVQRDRRWAARELAWHDRGRAPFFHHDELVAFQRWTLESTGVAYDAAAEAGS